MKSKKRLFLILWIAGFLGVLSFLLVDLTAMLAHLPVTAGKPIPFSPLALKLLGLIQPTILVSLAVLIGVRLARKVGLSAPAAEALADGGNVAHALRPQLVPGVLAGIIGGVAVIALWLLWRPFLPPEFVARAEELNKFLPLPTRLLYGGVTEELLLRWGVMTMLVWLPFRFFQRDGGRPKTVWFVSAIVISAVLFGAGHLPVAGALGVQLTLPIIAYVVTVNAAFGLIAGFLYWKKGLESAVIAHMFVHVVILLANKLVM